MLHLGGARVVGQREVDQPGVGIDRGPFRAVHRRRAQRLGGQPCLDHHVALIGEPVGRRQRAGAMHQRQPLAAAPHAEARDVQRAFVQGALAERPQRPFVGLADELVDVLVDLVVSHVHDGAAAPGLMHERRLVLGAAERGPLHRRRVGVERVELDHPAEAVGLVRIVGGDDKALVVRGPVVAVPADAVGGLERRVLRLVGLLGPVDAEVAVEVLLAGQVGVPRGVAVRTVVDGAQQRAGGRIGRGLQQPVTGRGPGYGHRRVGRDPPVPGRAHNLPGAAGAACHFDDADTVRVLGLEHHLRRPISFGRHGRRAGVQVALVGVLHVTTSRPRLLPRSLFPSGK